MKNIFKVLLISSGIVLGYGSNVFAAKSSASVPISGSIVTRLSVSIQETSMDFGDIAQGESVTKDFNLEVDSPVMVNLKAGFENVVKPESSVPLSCSVKFPSLAIAKDIEFKEGDIADSNYTLSASSVDKITLKIEPSAKNAVGDISADFKIIVSTN